MKKLFAIALSVICLVALFFTAKGLNVASAETLTGAKLEYFELSKPLCVVKDGEVVYIAQKDLLVVFYTDEEGNETYKKVDLTPYGDFTVKQIAKYGNFLFTLCDSKLFALDLTSYEFIPLAHPTDNTISFENIDCFAISGDYFTVANDQRDILIFKLSGEDSLNFELVYTDKASDRASSIALTPDLNVFYYDNVKNKLFFVSKALGMQGPFQSSNIPVADSFAYDNAFYFKADDVIYTIEANLNATQTVVADLTKFDIQNSGDFFVIGDKILICDTQNNRVVEYDITQNALTSFEISFTKINLPTDFEIAFNGNPKYIDVAKGTSLYEIDFEQSQKLGYFVYNAYYPQQHDAEYLVISEIGSDYYLIGGDVTALVLADDFTPNLVTKTNVNKTAYLTTDAKAYLQPRLTKDFACFSLEKFSSVEVLSSLTLAGVDYSLIKQGESIGYIPTSFLVSALNKLPEYNSFKTANLTNKTVTLYSDEACTQSLESLPAHTQIIITDEYDSCYKVVHGEKVGYILKADVQKRGSLTNKRVAVILLLTIAVTVTVIFFEKKYVFNKKKRTISPR